MIESPAWYCVHTKPKCEHLAAGVLRSNEGIETFCPRIRFQRSTRRGKVWFIEALFPSYFFARFDASQSLRLVRHSQSVLRVVEFSGEPIPIGDSVIEDLRREMDGQELREVKPGLKVGDVVEVTSGPMRGFRGILNGVLSGEERVRILLDFLGRQSLVVVDAENIIPETQPRIVAVRR